MGGCLLNDTLDWGGYFFHILGLPPDPEIVGERKWRGLWKSRIEGMDCPVALWMAHQRRDAFWKHGSVIEDYSRIEVPVLNASGWVDGYTAAVFRTVEGLAAHGTLHELQRAFIEHHALQCGYCTPGFLMLAVWCVENKPDATDEELRDLVASNLCRCTGYQNIVRAIRAVMDGPK